MSLCRDCMSLRIKAARENKENDEDENPCMYCPLNNIGY